jgi:hypothetical protein
MQLIMMIVIFAVVSVSGVSYAQISDYIKEDKSAAAPVQQQCADVIVVRPELTSEKLGGSFKPLELQSASTLLANAFASQFNNSIVIAPDQIDTISKCTSKVIVVKLKSYSKQPAAMGQFEGNITVVAHVFKTPVETTPYISKEFSDSGRRHWGDNGPLLKAIDAVSGKIKKELGSI